MMGVSDHKVFPAQVQTVLGLPSPLAPPLLQTRQKLALAPFLQPAWWQKMSCQKVACNVFRKSSGRFKLHEAVSLGACGLVE